MKDFFDLSYEELVCLATSIGLSISGELTVNQQNILSNFYMLLGQVIVVANSVGSSYPPASNGPNYGPIGVGSLTGCRCGYEDNSDDSANIDLNDLQNKLNYMADKINMLEKEIFILNKKITKNKD